MSQKRTLSPVTLQDYMAATKKSLEGVYTFRLTPSTWKTPLNRIQIRNKLKDFINLPKVHRLMAFKEGEGDQIGQVKVHYHVRVETGYKTRKSINDAILSIFNISKEGGRSSRKYSVHACREKDRTWWKSKTYVAKQGDLVVRYNHTQEDIALAILWGRRLQNFSNKSITEQIIITWDIKDNEPLDRNYIEELYSKIVQFYQQIKDKVPSTKQIQAELHNVLFIKNRTYRDVHQQTLIDEFERKYMDLW